MSKANKPTAPKCSAEVYRNGNPFPFVCGKTASLEHEGVMYCKTHYPPAVKARRAAAAAKKHGA